MVKGLVRRPDLSPLYVCVLVCVLVPTWTGTGHLGASEQHPHDMFHDMFVH